MPNFKKILLVDDEPYNVLGMQMNMNQLGIKRLSNIVDRAYNGLEALNKVKDSFIKESHVYGLIFTDISMPFMDGYQSSEKIRNFYRAHNAPQPIIIACTGHIEEEYIKMAWASEIDEVIPKPVNLNSIQEIFNEIMIKDNNVRLSVS